MATFDRMKAWLTGAPKAKPVPPKPPMALVVPKPFAALPLQEQLDAMTVDELNDLNQTLGRRQEAIRQERKVIARTVDAKLKG